MVIRLSVIALLVSLSTVLSVGNPGVAFAAEATISVSPASVQIRPGDDVAIDYLVGDVGPLPGIGGYVLSVRFDPAVLELVTLLDGGFVTGGDNVVICGPTAIDNDAGIGVLFCAAVPLFGAPGVSTTQPVVLARSLFRARAPGMSVIDLEGTYLQGPNSEAIASTLSNGSVTVSPREEQVAATATAAPPTATSTASVAGAVPTATATAAATVPAVLTRTSATPESSSTKRAAGTLSNVDAPRAGSGTTDDSELMRWVTGIVVAGAGMLGLGGWAAMRFRRRSGP